MDKFASTFQPPTITAKNPIFIVDDDAALLNALRFFFETQDFPTWGFRTAAAAEAAWAVQHPACVIIDQRLPGEAGIDFLKRLRSRNIMTPALLITTAPSHALLRQAQALDVPVIEKPLLSNDLLVTAKRLMRE